jgi:hypothetical protein
MTQARISITTTIRYSLQLSMITVIDGAFFVLFDGLPASASRLL